MSRFPAPATLNRLSADPRHQSGPVAGLTIDPRRPWVPEHRTQLYYTPIYASLHYEHRLRYNQLFGLRINEYGMMLEEEMTERLLAPVRDRATIRADAELARAVDFIRSEEASHFRLFAQCNRAARPDLYPPGQDRLFSRLPWWAKAMFRFVGHTSHFSAYGLWYVIAMEESSLSLAREMKEQPETETLGPLDPGFTAVQVEHARDEARHVPIEAQLIECLLAATPAWRRAIDARLFKAMLKGLVVPTRGGAGARVVRQLVREMPELKDREEEMIQAVLGLRHNPAFMRSLFNRAIMPVSFALFDAIPELADLGERMAGYDRRAA